MASKAKATKFEAIISKGEAAETVKEPQKRGTEKCHEMDSSDDAADGLVNQNDHGLPKYQDNLELPLQEVRQSGACIEL
jgi:hypothetical protein